MMSQIRKVWGGMLYYSLLYHFPSSTFPVFGRLCRKLRCAVCRFCFDSIGKNVNIERHAYWGFNQVSIGNESGIGVNFHLQNCRLTIGNNVMMGPNVRVIGGGHRFDRTDIPMGEQGDLPKSVLSIEDDVWIGDSVMILGKCRCIGEGAIIGASAVVTKDIPPYAIVAGNPARIIRFRK